MDSGKFFWGLIFFGIGIAFLGINLGLWGNEVWNYVWQFWPLILVFVGLRLIFKKDIYFLLSLIMVIAVIGALGFYSPQNFSRVLGNNFEIGTEEIVVENTDKDAILNFNVGASKVVFKESGTESLVMLQTTNYGKIEQDIREESNVKEVTFTEKVEQVFFRRLNHRELIALINPSKEVEINLNGGAGLFELDFSNINLKRLNLSAGASQIKVRFGSRTQLTESSIDAGVSNIVIEVPKDSGVKITGDLRGLNNVKTAEGLRRESDNLLVSNNYEGSSKKIDLNLSVGLSNLEIVRY